MTLLEPFDKYKDKLSLEFKGKSLRALISLLEKKDRIFRQLRKNNKLNPEFMILIDSIRADSLDARLTDSSKVLISRTVTGG